MSVNTQENIFLCLNYTYPGLAAKCFLVLNMTERNTFGGMRNHGYILHRQKGNRSAGMEERTLLPEVYCLISPKLFPFEVDEHVKKKKRGLNCHKVLHSGSRGPFSFYVCFKAGINKPG